MISVIVPVCNVESYLNQCVESIVNQTYKNLEIILVDDGSTDGSEAICDRWKETDSRILVIHQENQGVAVARNAGLACARGDFIAFVDSDDYLHPQMYELLLEAMKQSNAEIALCQEVAFYGDVSISLEVNQSLGAYTTMSNKQYIAHFLDDFIGQYTWVWNKLYARELIGEKRFQTMYSMEDTCFSIDLAMETNLAVRLEGRLYYYRQRKESIMNQPNPQKLLDYKDSYLHIYDKILESKIEDLQSDNLVKCLERLTNLEAKSFWLKQREIRKEIRTIFIQLYDSCSDEVDNRQERLKLYLARKFCYLYYLLKYRSLKMS